MDLTRKTIQFSDGREITVSESTWESASIRSRIEETSRARRSHLNGSGDPVFFFFVETFYSYLASCSSGAIPSEEEAYILPDPDLDSWYQAVISVNPESFIKVDLSQKGEIVFRDGSRFTIISSYLPSVVMKRARLEEEALKREEDRSNPKDIFGVILYPILAACTLGELPPPDEIRKSWPELEIYKWRDAVEEVNPQWFGSPEAVEERSLQQSQELEKKKERPLERS